MKAIGIYGRRRYHLLPVLNSASDDTGFNRDPEEELNLLPLVDIIIAEISACTLHM